MAKSGVSEEDPPAAAAKAAELKRELQKLVKEIVDEDDVNLEAIDRGLKMLSALKEMKLNGVVSFKVRDHNCGTVMDSGEVPKELKCLISKEIMRDLVIVATGQTYDRPFIQKWLTGEIRPCPQSQQVLSHTDLTPNHLIREMITEWCKNHAPPLHGIQFPVNGKYFEEDVLTEADRDHFISLLEKMSSTVFEQKQAAKELRQLTKRVPSFRALFGESLDAMPKLLSPLSGSEWRNEIHSDLQEDIITTVLNLSIHDTNKKLVAETPMVIPLLIDALRLGTVETRSNAAAALFTLSALDSNKNLIGKSGALKALVDLLDKGHPLTMKDTASAIFNLCIIHENKVRAVRDGAVRVILNKIMSRVHVDELVSILAMLSTNQKAIEEMEDLGAVSCLFGIIRETSCARSKENCIAILYTICFNDRSKWKEMREEESIHHTISHLAQNGTSRARRKASSILERLNRCINLTHTA